MDSPMIFAIVRFCGSRSYRRAGTLHRQTPVRRLIDTKDGTLACVSSFAFMPRYFFNITHERRQIDEVGEDLPDKHAAWKEATVTAGQILQGIDGDLRPGREWRMEVTDESRNTLFVLRISAERPR